MLDVSHSRVAVIACLGTAEALDTIEPPTAFACRVAPDELLLLAPSTAATDLERLAATLAEVDPDGLIADVSAGFACWTLAGDGADEAFARVSAVPLPRERPAFLQGAVAGVQGRILFSDERVDILVVSTVAAFVRRRILHACRDLAARELGMRDLRLPAAATAEAEPA